MISELYDIIVSVYTEMNRTFEIPLQDISGTTQLKELEIDSLTFIMIMLKIEQKYQISLTSQNAGTFDTVQDVVDAVESALKK